MKDINATVIVDLKPSEVDILKDLDKDARWGINKAIKEGLRVEECKDIGEIYNLYKESMEIYGIKSKSLEELKEKSKKTIVCKKDDKIIAAAGIEFEDNKPVLYFNASLKEYRSLQPNNLLYWELIRWCKYQGYEEFDLGGWQINARGNQKGINEFKERWGKIVYYKKDYPVHKAIGRKLIRNFSFFWWLNKKIKGRK